MKRFAVKKSFPYSALLFISFRCPKVTNIGSVIGCKIDYNGEGFRRSQRYIPSNN